MKKIVSIMLFVLAFGSLAMADTYSYEYVAAANYTNVSDQIPVSGYLDKIELSGLGATRTSGVVVATYTGTTAIDTLASVSALTTPVVVRLRVQPTDNTGTVIPSVWSAAGTGGTNASTILSIVYDKVLVGGNIKITIINAHANAQTNKITFYYEPLKK